MQLINFKLSEEALGEDGDKLEDRYSNGKLPPENNNRRGIASMGSPLHRAPRQPPGAGGGGAGTTARTAVTPTEPMVKRYDNIVKSQEDKREYRGLELSNRLKVLLISDPKTDKSAAAMDVNIGYLSDPEELPGLAHFCEHMLFLGTKKYPEENEYNKFLSEHGGSSNASTSSDHTTYYFDVMPDHLPMALDIFAQFFIAPLFTESATEREINAVNSEHEKNTSSDTWRLDQLNKSSASKEHPYHKFGTVNSEHEKNTSSDTWRLDQLNKSSASKEHPYHKFGTAPSIINAVNSEHEKNTSSDTWRLDQLNKSSASKEHPYHKFGTGNKDTLDRIPKEKGIDVRAELLKFHGAWYSADIMTLAVCGKESLDELEALVTPLFSAIEEKGVTAPTWPEAPFPPELRKKRAYCMPVKDLRSLSIDFPVPDSTAHYKSAPGHYLSHLLGHEGPGSLLAALKARGWCNR
ncbi:unnamed protein product [Plutella xylostella]|uniref:(diamondback moth) hypothetical protein n=1 Tax=Plutella xylostella TaxID=51655 RepID=A0A8S4DY99_PLUXY|nr:unnamed protein product [Plutella xylostella]